MVNQVEFQELILGATLHDPGLLSIYQVCALCISLDRSVSHSSYTRMENNFTIVWSREYFIPLSITRNLHRLL